MIKTAAWALSLSGRRRWARAGRLWRVWRRVGGFGWVGECKRRAGRTCGMRAPSGRDRPGGCKMAVWCAANRRMTHDQIANPSDQQNIQKHAARPAVRQRQVRQPRRASEADSEEVELIEACRQKTREALETILQLMEESDNDRVRLAAAQYVIERGWGKAPERIELLAATVGLSTEELGPVPCGSLPASDQRG